MIFILYFDRGYFEWSKYLLRSMVTHETKAKIIIFGFNLASKQIKYLENQKNVIEVINEKVKFKTESKFWVIVCQKCFFVMKTMEKYPEEDLYIVMDVDMLMVNPLDELKKGMVGHDIGLIVASKNKVPSGFLAFKKTAKGFLNEYHDRVYVKGSLHVKMKEQKILAEIYRDYNLRKRLKFLNLSRKYIDHEMNLDSFVWSAHKRNFGEKGTRLKLFSYVGNPEKTEADWQKYLRNWKKRMIRTVELQEKSKKERSRRLKIARVARANALLAKRRAEKLRRKSERATKAKEKV